MGELCVCREILLLLGERYRRLELNDQIWPRIQGKGISWAEMVKVLEKMRNDNLIIEDQRRVEGFRQALFYSLSLTGSKKLQEIRAKPRGGKNDTATDFGESCCITRAA